MTKYYKRLMWNSYYMVSSNYCMGINSMDQILSVDESKDSERIDGFNKTLMASNNFTEITGAEFLVNLEQAIKSLTETMESVRQMNTNNQS